MNGIGAILKRVRMERGINLEEIEEVTKIRIKYLKAIEDEQFDLLPGAVYAKGFVNTYIRYLNIGDWPEVLEVMQATPPIVASPIAAEAEELPERAEHRKSRSASHARLEDKPITSKKYLIIGISVVAIVALIFIQAVYNRQMPDIDDDLLTPPIQAVEPGDEEEVTSEDETPTEVVPPAVVYTGLNLELQIIDLSPSAVDKCWTTVSADGTNVFTETLNEGALKTITAEQSIHIRVGNGGVAKLTLNGQDLGVMGEKGQVVEKTFTLNDINVVNDAGSVNIGE